RPAGKAVLSAGSFGPRGPRRRRHAPEGGRRPSAALRNARQGLTPGQDVLAAAGVCPLIRDRPSNVAPSWITRLCVSTSPKSLPPGHTSMRDAPSTSPRTSPSTTSLAARTVASTIASGPTTSTPAARTSPLCLPPPRVGPTNESFPETSASDPRDTRTSSHTLSPPTLPPLPHATKGRSIGRGQRAVNHPPARA